jgi:hypothetical protein
LQKPKIKNIMKKIIVTFILSLCATLLSFGSMLPISEEEIEIRDIAGTIGTVLRSAPAPAVSAWLSDAQIDLTFLRYMGTVTITVANAQETVYTATVTAEEGVHTVISVAGWNAGDYTITIVRSNGQSFAGEFEL